MVTTKLWYVYKPVAMAIEFMYVPLQENFSDGLLLAMMSLLHQQSDQLLYKAVINTWSHFGEVSHSSLCCMTRSTYMYQPCVCIKINFALL